MTHLLLFVALCLLNGPTAVVINCPNYSSTLPEEIIIDIPNGCMASGSRCNYILRMAVNEHNESFIDVRLESTATGYAAVGFSNNRKMPYTDVLGCGRNAEGTLHIRDTWNPDYYNENDPNQDGMCVHSMSYQNSVLTCSFSRYAGVVNVGYDFDLNNSFYLLLAFSNNQNSNNNFPQHSITSPPQVTDALFNVYSVDNSSSSTSSDGSQRVGLIRAHGILMIVAWPLLAVIGIFFSAWTKPALPNGEWFQFHRALMILSVVVAITGFVLPFVANKDNEQPGLIELTCNRKTSHLIIGIVVTALQVLNPLIALCRCKPESKYRTIFNFVHGSGIGFFTELSALVNVGLGIALFQSDCLELTGRGNHILWVYLTWLAFVLIFQVSLFCTFTYISLKVRDTDRHKLAPSVLKPLLKSSVKEERIGLSTSAEMSGPHEDSIEEINNTPMRSKDSNIRLGSLSIFCIGTVLSVTILVVLLAIDEGSDD